MSDPVAEVISVDNLRLKAMCEKDVATLNNILAADLIYTHSSARRDTRESLISAMLSGATVYRKVEVSEVEGREVAGAVVLVGTAAIAISASGKPVEFGVRFTNVYEQRDGRWQMVVWQSTKTPAQV